VPLLPTAAEHASEPGVLYWVLGASGPKYCYRVEAYRHPFFRFMPQTGPVGQQEASSDLER
jgi:hypothetical protein